MKVAWTTAETRDQAEKLSAEIIEAGLAACAQISGPITSIYRWKGKTERSEEYRITFKFADDRLERLRGRVLSAHPYDTPQWVVADISDVSEAYRRWAEDTDS